MLSVIFKEFGLTAELFDLTTVTMYYILQLVNKT